MEKIIKPVSGFLVLILTLIGFGVSIYLLTTSSQNDQVVNPLGLGAGIALMLVSVIFFKGLTIVNPNQSAVCTFFGKYAGTVKSNGLLFINPFFKKEKVSLRAN